MKKLADRNWPDHEFAESLESKALRSVVRRSAIILAIIVTGVILWSVKTSIDEVSRAQGQVVPFGNNKVIQSQDGGTIAELYVEEGQLIEEGEKLLSFKSQATEAEKNVLEARLAFLELEIERHSAFVEERPPAFDIYAAEYPLFVRQQKEALMASRQSLEDNIYLVESNIEKNQAEIESVEKELPKLEEQLASSQEALDMLRGLSEKKLVSQIRVLDATERTIALERQYAVLEGQLDVLKKDSQTLLRSLQQVRSEAFLAAAEQKSDLVSERRQLEEQLERIQGKLDETVILSPVSGVVQSVPTTAQGGVIQPGGTVAVIVPQGPVAVMEAKLSPRDVGFVQVGQPARIKIDAFDYSRYGALEGVVKKISPTTDSDEANGVYYKIQVTINQPYLGKAPTELALIPGMTGQVDIRTGQKTVFQYLWKPVYTNISTAFGER